MDQIQASRSVVGTRVLGVVFGGAAALMLSASLVAAQSPAASPPNGMAVAAPGSEPMGVAYGEWAGRWWKNLFALPAATNPAVVDNCDANLVGDVLMLPQTTFGNALATTCHITEGQSILASPGGTFCDDVDGTTPTEVAMLRCVDLGRNSLSGARLTIDGVDVPDVAAYWTLSPLMELTYPEGNIFGLPATDAKGVGGGWFLVISGLESGTHEIVVHDDLTDAGEHLPADVTATVEVAAK